MWSSTDDPLTANVPLNPKQIDRLQEHYFSAPSVMPLCIKIAVKATEKSEDIMSCKGSMFRLSPVEIVAALYKAIATAIRASVGDEELGKWRDKILSTPFEFVICEGEDDRHFAALQMREDIAQNFSSMRYSTLMRIFDLEAFMKRKADTTGKLTAKQCADLYRQLKVADISEQITDTFVDVAMTICSRMLSIPACKAALIEVDQEYGANNPLDSYNKLQALIQKSKVPAKLEWVVLLLLDLHKSNALRGDQIGVRTLQGAKGDRGRSLVDLLMYKEDVLNHLTSTVLDSLALEPSTKSKIRAITASLATYRTNCGYSYNSAMPSVKRTWMAGWAKSATLFLTLIDSCVYSYEMDDALRIGMKNNKDGIYSFNHMPRRALEEAGN
jgi:hypothetical protein